MKSRLSEGRSPYTPIPRGVFPAALTEPDCKRCGYGLDAELFCAMCGWHGIPEIERPAEQTFVGMRSAGQKETNR